MSESMGSIIRRLRKERGLTQEELAVLLGVTFQAISKWENGTGLPDISQVVPLSNVFGVSTDVIFGINIDKSDDDIEEFIRGIERKVCNCSDSEDIECGINCIDEIRKKLKEFPSNYYLLTYSMGRIHSTICDLDGAGRHDEAKTYISEFIRNGNMVLSHCTDAEHLNEANKWFTYFYLHIGDKSKAEEHARRIPKRDEGWSMLAYVKESQGEKEEAMKLISNVVSSALQDLAYELQHLGRRYDSSGKFKEAYECFRLFPDIYDLIMKDREDDIPFYSFSCYDQLAVTCMKLGRYDEAVEYLEKYLAHEEARARTYNVVTESKIPYFYGRTLKFSHDHYTARGDISEVMGMSIFDPIRDTDRFRALIKEVTVFEDKYKE